GADDQMRVRVPASEHLDDVADRRALERGDDADLARQGRKRSFATDVEEAVLLQLLFQLFECELERAKSLWLHVLAVDLILAARLVDGDLPACDDVGTVHGFELQISQRRAEHEALQLRSVVLQREIEMAVVPDLAVGEFTFDPHLEQLTLEEISHTNGEVADRVNPSGFGIRG